MPADLHFTTHQGDGGDRARTAAARGYTAIAVVGGDGTVNEVVNGLPDFTLPLAALPLGTANVLAMELHLPRRPDELAALIAEDRRRRLAVAVAGDRRFLLFCGAGLDGAAVHRLAQVRTGTLGKHKWLGPIWHIVRHLPRFSLRAEFADGEVLDDLSSVLVTRVRNYGGLFLLTPGIDAGDGQLHVLCFRHRSRLQFFWLGVLAFCGRLRPSRRLLVRATSAVRIQGDAPCQLDGDAAGHAPVEVRLLGAELELFAPGQQQ
jgi:diacylglycerol kinase family enzyme